MMHWIALFSRLLLAAVFVIAAIGKLTDPGGTRQALGELGVPIGLVRQIAFMLPLVEMAVAVLLLASATAGAGAAAALALLAVFIAVIAVSLARGRTPDCHCFGQLHSAPIGAPTLLRNTFLAALAGLVLWHGGANPHITGGTPLGAVSWIALAVAVAALAVAAIEAWLLIGLLPQQGRLLLRLEALETALGQGRVHGLPVGEKAPDFELRDLAGQQVSLARLRSSERPVLLFFTNPHCGPCDELLPKIKHWQQQHGDRLQIAVIGRDSVEVNREKAARHGLQTVLLQRKREVVEAYQVESTPAAVLVDADGRVASQLAYGPAAIAELVERGRIGPVNGRDEAGESPSLTVGEPAPHLVLPDLEGNTTSLSELQGTSTLVLFWNPDCGFCRQLLPALTAWERARPDESPQLFVVSRGSAEVNRGMGFRSPVVLDSDGAAMRAFGVSGTPMGVLVDTDGRIASSVAAGAQQVMALAISRHSEVRA